MTTGMPSAWIDSRAASTVSSFSELFAGVAMIPFSSTSRIAARRASRDAAGDMPSPACSTRRTDSTIASMESYPYPTGRLPSPSHGTSRKKSGLT